MSFIRTGNEYTCPRCGALIKGFVFNNNNEEADCNYCNIRYTVSNLKNNKKKGFVFR